MAEARSAWQRKGVTKVEVGGARKLVPDELEHASDRNTGSTEADHG
jgi:hypothetical protein